MTTRGTPRRNLLQSSRRLFILCVVCSFALATVVLLRDKYFAKLIKRKDIAGLYRPYVYGDVKSVILDTKNQPEQLSLDKKSTGLRGINRSKVFPKLEEPTDHPRVEHALDFPKDITSKYDTNGSTTFDGPFTGPEQTTVSPSTNQSKTVPLKLTDFDEVLLDNSTWITAEFMGRLGNNMFQYACALALAKEYGFKAFLHNSNHLSSIFKLGNETRVIFQPYSLWKDVTKIEGETPGSGYDKTVQHLSIQTKFALLTGYRQSWRYFMKYGKDVRRHFEFRSEVSSKTDGFITELKGRGTRVLVAVHVRRGDMLNLLKTNDFFVADENYFQKAMNYFRRKFKGCLFVVCSDGMEWARKEIKSVDNDVIFANGSSQAVDLAIMARCDHMIMSVGTFGWWAAWLAGGEVIYYRTPANWSQWYSDFFPSDWIGMA